MMFEQKPTIERRGESILATNKVLRNTYFLLALTLVFSALTASYAMATQVAPLNPILTLVVYFVLLFATQALRNSVWGLVLVFALTGFLGYTIGPILNYYITAFSNGNELIMMALGSTGVVFFVLSAIAMTTKRDFTNMGTLLFAGAIVVLVAVVANLFLKLPALALAISIVLALISAGYILYTTNMIVRGGENNYISATVMLYVSLLNIFLTLLQLFGMFAGNRD
ncbi:Bax inhibitor-1/YccA family protein [Piscirickettsia salmonis]|nr:Bax inhibitor-1/YccA family protein [Piscirickettsia salmonis]